MASLQLSAGTRLQILVDEDGTPKPPALPPATVRRRLVSLTHVEYALVELDNAVECLRADTRSGWVLRELLVSPAFRGQSFERALEPPPDDFVLVNIANVLSPPYPPGDVLDLSRSVYFARGRMVRFQPG